MKLISERHPRLYIKILSKSNGHYNIEYYENRYNSDGSLIINSDNITKSLMSVKKSNKQNLYDLNKTEFQMLTNIIKRQEKVLEIYSNKNKLDQFNVISSSLNLLFKYKERFLKWFSQNEYDNSI